MVKKCLLKILLVEETDEKTCEEIEEDIMREAGTFLRLIPWADRIEEIKIVEN